MPWITVNSEPPKPTTFEDLGYVQVVRCKDCVNSGTSRCPCHSSGDPYIDWNPDDDWFCADGERKET
jgi:hypothetical protein